MVEFQARGVVHVHVPIRIDGPEGPDGASTDLPLSTAELEQAVGRATATVRLRTEPLGDGSRYELRWGSQVDCRPVTGDAERDGDPSSRRAHPKQVAAYLARYLTKSTEDFGLPSRVRSAAHARHVGATPHAVRIIETVERLSTQGEAYVRLRDYRASLGYRGHPITKSRAYSITFGQLRRARRAFRREPGVAPDADVRRVLDDDTEILEGFELVSNFVFVGRGYLELDQAAAAVRSAAVSRTRAVLVDHNPAASRQPAHPGHPAGRQGRSAAESGGHEVPLTR